MAQADQSVQNATFPTVRADINDNLAALFSNNSGNTAPTVTVAYQDWIDTSGADPLWKKRNAANNAWITIGTIKSSTIELAADNVLPSQSGQSGKYLTTDGTVASWAPIPAGTDYQVFTTSGTWIKPADISIVYVELWGAGGGGARGSDVGGGGGGAFRWAFIRASDLSATESVTIGAGGAGRTVSNGVGSDGGNTTFDNLIAGGGGGGASTGSGGGGGGWRTGASTTSAGSGYREFGSGDSLTPGNPLWVGAVGGEGSGNGGDNVYGGGGGGGRDGNTVRAGGTSFFGGNGGAGGGTSGTNGGAGVAPGGGGGGCAGANGGDGARGEARIYAW